MKKLILILLLGFCSLSFANTDNLDQTKQSIFAEDPWDFLEKQFVQIPESKAASIDKVGIKLLITAVPALYAWVLSWVVSDLYISTFARETFNAARKPDDPVELAVFKICTGLSILASLLPTYYATQFVYDKAHNYILIKIEEDNLKAFIENWPTNKQIMPEQFHQDFERLYIEFKKQASTLDIKKVNTLLKKSIARHFVNSTSIK